MNQKSHSLKEAVFVAGKVVHGFGRGSKQLGVPTANLEESVAQNLDLESGIYYGFIQLIHPDGSDLQKLVGTCQKIYPSVLSFGWNPHFNDLTKRTLEAHLLHKFDYDFYGSQIRIAICGYIRPEVKFNSLQELKDTINQDIAIAEEKLNFPEKNWQHIIHNDFFKKN